MDAKYGEGVTLEARTVETDSSQWARTAHEEPKTIDGCPLLNGDPVRSRPYCQWLTLLLTEAVHASYSWQFGLGIGSNHEDRVTDVAFDPNDQYIYAVGYSENNNALNTGLVYSESDQGFLDQIQRDRFGHLAIGDWWQRPRNSLKV